MHLVTFHHWFYLFLFVRSDVIFFYDKLHIIIHIILLVCWMIVPNAKATLSALYIKYHNKNKRPSHDIK